MTGARGASRARAALGVLAILGVACAVTRRLPAAPTWPWAEPRQAYLRTSAVWLGDDLDSWVAHMHALDLFRGPDGDGAFAPNELVRCEYVEPKHGAFSGATPKFLCRRGPHDQPFKVKWGEDNGEIYADLAGTRLFWALGFGADRIYPLRVECVGCADDPWKDPAPHPGHVPPTFEPAIAERQAAGDTIEEYPHQGFTWKEFEQIDAAAGGAPRAQLDALKLLAVFVQYRDSKADNQRLLCLPGTSGTSRAGRTCPHPFAMIDDLGSTFGGTHVFRTHKMDLDYWASEPVWKDPAQCVANLTSELDARDGLDFPHIGEPGRRFLATLLGALDDRQIADLFRAARAERRGPLARWVAVFRQRRDQIRHPVPGDRHFRCPEVGRAA